MSLRLTEVTVACVSEAWLRHMLRKQPTQLHRNSVTCDTVPSCALARRFSASQVWAKNAWQFFVRTKDFATRPRSPVSGTESHSKAADVIMQSDYSRSCKLDHYILNAWKLRG